MAIFKVKSYDSGYATIESVAYIQAKSKADAKEAFEQGVVDGTLIIKYKTELNNIDVDTSEFEEIEEYHGDDICGAGRHMYGLNENREITLNKKSVKQKFNYCPKCGADLFWEE